MNANAFEFFQKGISFQQRGVYDCAVQEYDKALKIEPDNVDILLNCGAACLQRGWVEKSINFLTILWPYTISVKLFYMRKIMNRLWKFSSD